ncbi:MAG TPA: DUF1592 domain-containing protein [Gammaproteobacteria bacterium]
MALAGCAKEPVERLAAQWDLLDRYCTECHNDAEFAGDLSLQGFAAAEVPDHPALFEKVVRKLRGDLMPPPGGPRPAPEEVDRFVASLEATLDEAAAARGVEPGRVAVHRLNRTEYATAVADLLGIDIDARALLPADASSEGFDNVAEVLRVSPTHLDQYLAAAREISIRAVGNPAPEPTRSEYRNDRKNPTAHVDGTPLGTRGGFVVEHYFPADGEYEIDLNVSSEPGQELRAYPTGWIEYRHKVILTIDGEKVFEGELGGEEDSRAIDQQQILAVEAIRDRFRNIRVPVKAGKHEIAAAFVARSFAEGDYLLQSLTPGEGMPDVPRMHGIEILGPYGPMGINEPTESRRRIFICYPQTPAEELPCAEEILTNLARQAFRRPIQEKDLSTLLAFYEAGREEGGFEAGIQKGLMAILASTKFLYRAEPGGPPADVAPGEPYFVSDLELAWRLAFFLWSRGPDEQLLKLAEAGQLRDDAVLEREVQRLLADPRSRSLVTNFAFQWLGVRRLDTMDPDPRLYPNFDEDLRNAFRTEMELFLDSILRNPDASVLEVLSAKHTFVNERLARHYGIPSVRGDRFRRVELEDPRRWGLFGKGSVLTVTSYPDRTSPVLRGAWILEQVLGTPPAPVPPNVETDLAQPTGDVPLSVRERLARHRTQTTCNHCHGVIDPLGQALEHFNAIGEWREVERENGARIDSSGRLADGREVNGPEDLREALLADPKMFVQALTEKLMVYALGRGLEYYDMPTVRRIVRDAEKKGYTFASIAMGIVKSAPFRMRTAPAPEGGTVEAALRPATSAGNGAAPEAPAPRSPARAADASIG